MALRCGGAEGSWKVRRAKLLRLVKDVFGHDGFRGKQEASTTDLVINMRVSCSCSCSCSCSYSFIHYAYTHVHNVHERESECLLFFFFWPVPLYRYKTQHTSLQNERSANSKT